MTVRFVNRQQAQNLLLKKWDEAMRIANEVKLPYRLYDWETLRNYEFEDILFDVLGNRKDRYVISEWCPYDFIYVAYFWCASKHDLKETKNRVEESTVENLNKEGIIKRIDEELEKRPKELGEKEYWVEGYKIEEGECDDSRNKQT